ncbi:MULTISPECIES: hypothetical protein [Catenuloplanes]|uniref:Uncharacterized protein n=1 Tax=Catenuloplanes niger TaxID=587534 RepID=A0AAE4CY98_9ACTN|nr:hypothetical protein [Catenuloplanes niger]MDR7325604.1 hypothetical protein [Catenuloplanes niger]
MKQALKDARLAGWHLRETAGHGYGRAFCRRVERGGAVCKIIIDTTPRNPEARAKDLVRAIRDCPHHFADLTVDLSYADNLLSGADRLLDAAEYFLDAEEARSIAGDAWQRAQELLDTAAGNADEVARVMATAQEFDDEARHLTEKGWIRGAESGIPDGAPHTYVAGAEQRTDEATSLVAEAIDHEDPIVGTLRERLSDTRTRIADVRLRLGHGTP